MDRRLARCILLNFPSPDLRNYLIDLVKIKLSFEFITQFDSLKIQEFRDVGPCLLLYVIKSLNVLDLKICRLCENNFIL